MFRVDLRRALQMHRGLALGIALAGILLAALYFLRMWPMYIASSLVYVQPATPKVLDGAGGNRWPYDTGTYESYLAQQMLSVTRPDVLEKALQKLGPGPWKGSKESEQAAVDRLGRAIDVARVGATYQFAISAHASDPSIAAQMANAVTEAYIASANIEARAGDSQRLAVLREEQGRVQKEMDADQTEQASLNKQLGVAALGTGAPDLIDDDIARTRAALTEARTNYDQAAAHYSAMNAGQGDSSVAINSQADEMIATDSGLTSMKTSLNQRRAALITQMANLTPNNPEYKQDAAELAKINSSIDAMMKDLRAKASARIQQKLSTDLEQAAGMEGRINSQLRTLVASAGDAGVKMQRSKDLSVDVARLQARYTAVDDQIHNVLLEDGAPGAIYLTNLALPPLKPVKSGVIRSTFMLGFFGIVFGILAAVAAHKLDPRLYIASDVEQVLGFAPMAQLPDFDEVSDGVAGEHLLRFATALEFARKQDHLRSCIFTGTRAGAGVTTLATRVHGVLEAMGRQTVLVDANGIPAMSAQEYAVPEARFNDVTQPGSERGSRSTALLQRVAAESASQKECLVITDAAPLALSAESEYLARHVDCAIVVIESGVTTRAQLRTTSGILQRLDVGTVGFVLNRVGLKKADPAFRRSVQETEKHLAAQSKVTTRHTVRSRSVVAEPVAEPERRNEAAVVRREEPAVAQAAPAVPERSVQSAAPPPLAELAAARTPAPEPAPAAPAQSAQVPWWLADSQPAATTAESEVREPAPSFPAPQMWRQPEPLPVRERAARVEERPAARELQPEPEEASATPSRLSGLRNLFFAKGIKTLHSTREIAIPQQPEEPAAEMAVAQTPEIDAVDAVRTFVPFPEPEPEVVSSPEHAVMAEPEFLPPRPMVETTDGDKSETARRDRRDTFDDIAILPSWRGQYKKKS